MPVNCQDCFPGAVFKAELLLGFLPSMEFFSKPDGDEASLLGLGYDLWDWVLPFRNGFPHLGLV